MSKQAHASQETCLLPCTKPLLSPSVLLLYFLARASDCGSIFVFKIAGFPDVTSSQSTLCSCYTREVRVIVVSKGQPLLAFLGTADLVQGSFLGPSRNLQHSRRE